LLPVGLCWVKVELPLHAAPTNTEHKSTPSDRPILNATTTPSPGMTRSAYSQGPRMPRQIVTNRQSGNFQ